LLRSETLHSFSSVLTREMRLKRSLSHSSSLSVGAGPNWMNGCLSLSSAAFQNAPCPCTQGLPSTAMLMSVPRITQRMFVGGGGGFAEGMSWKDLCQAPCEFELEPGLHELMVKGDGLVPVVRQFNLVAGDQYFVAKPGSRGLRMGGVTLASLGFGAITLATVIWLLPRTDTDYDPATMTFTETERPRPGWVLPVLLGGVAATGLGIGMYVASGSSLDQESGPRHSGGTPIPRAVSYRTSF